MATLRSRPAMLLSVRQELLCEAGRGSAPPDSADRHGRPFDQVEEVSKRLRGYARTHHELRRPHAAAPRRRGWQLVGHGLTFVVLRRGCRRLMPCERDVAPVADWCRCRTCSAWPCCCVSGTTGHGRLSRSLSRVRRRPRAAADRGRLPTAREGRARRAAGRTPERRGCPSGPRVVPVGGRTAALRGAAGCGRRRSQPAPTSSRSSCADCATERDVEVLPDNRRRSLAAPAVIAGVHPCSGAVGRRGALARSRRIRRRGAALRRIDDAAREAARLPAERVVGA